MTTTQLQSQLSQLPNPNPRLHFVHVPTPGDHYSPATGSAVMTVIHGMTAPHVAAGHAAMILVSRGTMENYPPYPAGETREIDLPTALPGKARKICDAVWGRLFATRPNAAGQYEAVAAMLGASFDGTLFLHNAPAAIPFLRKRMSHAYLALYAHNQLFNTYGTREIRHVIDSADVILCVSNFIAKDIAARAGIKAEKLKTILNGVDTVLFQPATPAALQSDIPVIMFLGRVQREKGPDLLLKAAAEIDLPFKIRIVGSSNFNARDPLTPYEHELRRLADALGDKVEFHPFVPREKVADEYRRAAIFTAPSNWDEPFGLTIAEALACGLPCVLSNRGGIPEVAADAALYFAPPDTQTLARHLRNLLQDPALRHELSRKARARAEFLAWPRRYQALLEALNISSLDP